MSENRTRAIGLPILENDQFDLNREDVEKILKETEEELRTIQERMDVYTEEREKQRLVSRFKKVQAQLSALSQPKEVVLATVRNFYDRTAELGKQGLDEDAILEQLINENKLDQINAHYGLLRTKMWGYRLGQRIMEKWADQTRRK